MRENRKFNPIHIYNILCKFQGYFLSEMKKKNTNHESEDYRLQNLHEKGILISIFNVNKKIQCHSCNICNVQVNQFESYIFIHMDPFNKMIPNFLRRTLYIFKIIITSSIIQEIFNQFPLFCMALNF